MSLGTPHVHEPRAGDGRAGDHADARTSTRWARAVRDAAGRAAVHGAHGAGDRGQGDDGGAGADHGAAEDRCRRRRGRGATALEKLPADRFATAAEFGAALANAGAQRTGAGRTGGAGRRRQRRRPWLGDWRSWAAIGAGGGGRIVVSAVLVSRGERGRDALAGVAFAQQTFAPQAIFNARFAPDGKTIVYSAALEGNTPHLYVIRPDYPEPSPIGRPTRTCSPSRRQGTWRCWSGHGSSATGCSRGRSPRMPLGGGAPREIARGRAGGGLVSATARRWPSSTKSAGRTASSTRLATCSTSRRGYLSEPRVSPRGDERRLFEHPTGGTIAAAVIVVDRQGRRTVLSEARRPGGPRLVA